MGVMISDASVQTFVLTAQPKTSAPHRPGSETRNSDSPTIRARTSSLTLGIVVALLRMAVERLWLTHVNRAWRHTYQNGRRNESHFHGRGGFPRLSRLSIDPTSASLPNCCGSRSRAPHVTY